jgi:hypothetical protein
MIYQLEVLHNGNAWVLQCPGKFEPNFFSSGWGAEAAGRFLSLRLALSGHEAELVIRGRRGIIVGRVEYPSSRSWCADEVASWRYDEFIDAGTSARAASREPEVLSL